MHLYTVIKTSTKPNKRKAQGKASKQTESKRKKLKEDHKDSPNRSSGIKFAKGFHLPTQKETVAACNGSSKDTESVAFNTSVHSKFFRPVPPPSCEDDWLAQYNEEGQTFKQFKQECPWLLKRKLKYCKMQFNPKGRTLPEKYPDGIVYLRPIGSMKEEFYQHLSDLADYARKFLCLPVTVLLPGVELKLPSAGTAIEGEEGLLSLKVNCMKTVF